MFNILEMQLYKWSCFYYLILTGGGMLKAAGNNFAAALAGFSNNILDWIHSQKNLKITRKFDTKRFLNYINVFDTLQTLVFWTKFTRNTLEILENKPLNRDANAKRFCCKIYAKCHTAFRNGDWIKTGVILFCLDSFRFYYLY